MPITEQMDQQLKAHIEFLFSGNAKIVRCVYYHPTSESCCAIGHMLTQAKKEELAYSTKKISSVELTEDDFKEEWRWIASETILMIHIQNIFDDSRCNTTEKFWHYFEDRI